jgi:hypothetical protein
MKEFNKLVQNQYKVLAKTGKLFRVQLTGREVWDLYLNSFSDEDNPTFRDPESSTQNCNHCKNFIRRYGNVVAIDKNFKIITLFDFKGSDEYAGTAEAMSKAIKKSKIVDIFLETFNELNSLPYESCKKTNSVFRLGVASNGKTYTKDEAEKYGVVSEGETRIFDHFHIDLDSKFVDKSGDSSESLIAKYRDDKNVFKRAMDEISLDTLKLVKDLISQGSLLNGDAHIHKVKEIIPLMEAYNDLSSTKRDNWAWVKSYKYQYAKFRNELIGVLCSELSDGEDLVKACRNWNKRVDPKNYMKASAPITQKQIEDAKKFVIENGYEESFNRRLATINDIKVTEIKHINSGSEGIKEVSIFDGVKANKSRHKRNEFDGIEEVSIEKFMEDILPSCTSVEAFVQNNQEGNFVSLTTANIDDSKRIFKWDNNYSWTFKGNLAGKSQLTEMVEAKGGRTDGVFRFTHSWNELERNQSLMDLHVFMPGCQIPKQKSGGPHVSGRRVGWNKRNDSASGGAQDVDYTSAAPSGYVPVENITFPSLNRMPNGVYTCAIHNWSFRSSGGKGRAEIAFGSELFEYVYPSTTQNEWVHVAEVTLKDGQFSIKHLLPETSSNKEIYGVETNQFHKVKLVCVSPNHWGENKVGNKHYFFMLDKCKAEEDLRTFHNENLNSELLKHRKVMEVLGETNKISGGQSKDELSGLGFNATVKDELIVKLGGNFKRTVKIKF